MDLLNLGFVNLSSALPRKNGIIATNEQMHIDDDVARAEPTTSISNTKRKSDKSPIVATFEPMFITMLVFTYPLILR